MSNGISNAPVANPLDPGSDAHSVESAAADFTRMLEDEGKPPRSDPARNNRSRSSEPPEDDEGEAPDPGNADDGHDPAEADLGDPILDGDTSEEDNSEDDNPDDDQDDENDEGKPEDDDDDDDDGELNLDQEVEIVVAGEPVKVTLKEALNGYSREADYRQKTAALADERREVEEFAEKTVEERRKYDAALQNWVDMTAALAPTKEDLEKLKASDPNLYIQISEQWAGIQQKVAEAQAERDRIAAQEAEDATREHVKYVRFHNAKLLEAVPALSNPKKAKAFREAIFTYGKRTGYSDEEIMRGAVDYRDVLTLYKASRYDEIMRSRKAGQRPGKKAPKPSTSSQARSVSRTAKPGAKRALRDADRRLQRSGSVEDAALAFTAIINS